MFLYWKYFTFNIIKNFFRPFFFLFRLFGIVDLLNYSISSFGFICSSSTSFSAIIPLHYLSYSLYLSISSSEDIHIYQYYLMIMQIFLLSLCYCSFSSLVLSSVAVIYFYILSKRIFLTCKGISAARVVSIIKIEYGFEVFNSFVNTAQIIGVFNKHYDQYVNANLLD